MVTKPTLTDLLKEGIAKAPSFIAIERATGIKRQSLMRFFHGRGGLTLVTIETLSKHFGIEVKRKKR